MIESKKLVPNIYAQSRDYQTILKLLDMVANNAKIDSDNFTSLTNVDKCPSKLLPLIASYVGYKYDYSLSYDINRTIIKHYRELIKLRGSEKGIRLAVAIAVNAVEHTGESPTSIVDIEYDKTHGIIIIHLYYKEYLMKIRDLLEVVRPAGIGYKIVVATPELLDSQVYLIDSLTNNVYSKDADSDNIPDRSQIGDSDEDENGKNKVGFSEIGEIILPL